MINTAKFPWELSHPDNFFELSSLSPMIIGMFVTL